MVNDNDNTAGFSSPIQPKAWISSYIYAKSMAFYEVGTYRSGKLTNLLALHCGAYKAIHIRGAADGRNCHQIRRKSSPNCDSFNVNLL